TRRKEFSIWTSEKNNIQSNTVRAYAPIAIRKSRTIRSESVVNTKKTDRNQKPGGTISRLFPSRICPINPAAANVVDTIYGVAPNSPKARPGIYADFMK